MILPAKRHTLRSWRAAQSFCRVRIIYLKRLILAKNTKKERIRNMTGETLEQFYMRKLPELRRKKGVTRKDVAAGVGITLGKYDRWEAGKVLPKVGDVDRLTEYYGISIDEMLEITPEESAAINRQIIADAEHLPPELKENVLGIMKGSHPELFPKDF